MSIRNIPDDELDEFFKKTSENYPVNMDAGAWQQMEKKLDQAYRRTLLLRSSLAVVIAVSLVLLLFLTLGDQGTLTGDNQKENAPGFSESPYGHTEGKPNKSNKAIGQTDSAFSPLAQASSQRPSSASPDLLANQHSLKENRGLPSEANFSEGSKKAGAHLERDVTTTPRRANLPKPAAETNPRPTGKGTVNSSFYSAGADPENEQEAKPLEKQSSIGDNHLEKENIEPPVTTRPGQEEDNLSLEPAAGAGGPVVVGTEKKDKKEGSEENLDLPAPAGSPEPVANNRADQKDYGKAERRPFRFSLQMLVGPDLSSVGFPRPGQPGTNLGIMVEYHLSPRISLSGGMLHGNKLYQAGKYDYSPASKIWSYGVKPDRIDAVCVVIDIPLNIRFMVLASGRSSLYATTGLSTFLMRDERYSYTYKNPNPHLIGSWRVRNGSRHPFSVYNFSIGYERVLSERFSLQAEPFVKVPLGGVGFGSVKITSVGAFFSARYHFSAR